MPGEIELKVYGWGALSDIPVEVYLGLVVLFVVGAGVLVWRKGLREGARCTMGLLLVEWVFLILCTAVFFRESGENRRVNLVPLSSYFDIAENSYLMEVTAINILNVIMFIPVGLLSGFAHRGVTWCRILFAGLVCSFAIELLQFVFKKGLCEVDDILHNLLGCVVGFAIYKLLTRLIKYVQTLFQTSV